MVEYKIDRYSMIESNCLCDLDGLKYCLTQETNSKSMSQMPWDSCTHTLPSWLTDSTLRNPEKLVSQKQLQIIIPLLFFFDVFGLLY